jgi:hypothetical protein
MRRPPPIIAALLLAAGCCPHELTAPQSVNVEPLLAARFPQDRATILPLFPDAAEVIVSAGRHRDGYRNPSGIVEWVRLREPADRYEYLALTADVYLFRSEPDAAAEFDHWPDTWWRPDRGKFTTRGTPGNRCVISYLSRPRYGADVPFSCDHGTAYDSFVTFQKGRLVVTITQRSESTDPSIKERWIKHLAEILSRPEPDREH